MIETVKRWTIIALAILVAIAVLAIMAMRVEVSALQAKASGLEDSNTVLMQAESDNAKQLQQLHEEAKATAMLVESKRASVAIARTQTRSDVHAVRQELSTQPCAAVRLPAVALGLLLTQGGESGAGGVSASSR